jgi:putative N6-adenine-specific DNA methylase
MLFQLTCQKWLEQLTKKEIQKLGYKCQIANTAVTIDAHKSAMAQINLWSRYGNKLYLILCEEEVSSFDALFDFVASIDRAQYHIPLAPITFSVVTYESTLTSIPTIQSIAQKAVFTQLQKHYSTSDNLEFDDNVEKIEIRILLQYNKTTLMVNTSGEPLHKRGYRGASWSAPLNEALAAAIVHMCDWKYSNVLLDPCCGSGTIAIEAAMIAKRIAPGLRRKFMFENWDWYDKCHLQDAKNFAESVIIKDKEYEIFASDLDLEVLNIAKQNAKIAWVEDMITWIHKDIIHRKENSLLKSDYSIISNPPYGSRMGNNEDLENIYKTLIELCNESASSSIITGFTGIEKYVNYNWKWTYMNNGGLDCRIYNLK